MSEFHVEVVEVGPIDKHPNADSLGLTKVHAYPVIVRLGGDLKAGDKAVYVPVDAVVPSDDPRWAFLEGHCRIKAKRLRGIFSMGLLTPADAEWKIGEDVAERMRIVRYEPPEPVTDMDEADPGHMPVYTDIEGLRRWPLVLEAGEEVVVTEKLHGESFRAVFADGRLWVGSRTRFKKEGKTQWWRAAEKYGLKEKLARMPNVAFFGETHGYTGGFPYGVAKGDIGLRIFDVMDTAPRAYLDYDLAVIAATAAGLPLVPELYRGPYDPEVVVGLAEGKSTMDGSHVREGVVVRPVKERFDAISVGRVILKLHGEGFLLKK